MTNSTASMVLQEIESAILLWLAPLASADIDALTDKFHSLGDPEAVADAFQSLVIDRRWVDHKDGVLSVSRDGRMELAIRRFRETLGEPAQELLFEACAPAVLVTIASEDPAWDKRWVKESLIGHAGLSPALALNVMETLIEDGLIEGQSGDGRSLPVMKMRLTADGRKAIGRWPDLAKPTQVTTINAHSGSAVSTGSGTASTRNSGNTICSELATFITAFDCAAIDWEGHLDSSAVEDVQQYRQDLDQEDNPGKIRRALKGIQVALGALPGNVAGNLGAAGLIEGAQAAISALSI